MVKKIQVPKIFVKMNYHPTGETSIQLFSKSQMFDFLELSGVINSSKWAEALQGDFPLIPRDK